MMENKFIQGGQKPVYDPVTCKVMEVKSQGVLCASPSPGGALTGGLTSYSGSALW